MRPPGRSLDLCAGTMDLTALARARAASRSRRRRRLLRRDARGGASQGAARRERRRRRASRSPSTTASSPPSCAGSACATSPIRARVRARCCACLQPGGVFVDLELFRPDAHRDARVPRGVRARACCRRRRAGVSGDRGAYAYLAESMAGFLSRAEYERPLADVGFASVRGCRPDARRRVDRPRRGASHEEEDRRRDHRGERRSLRAAARSRCSERARRRTTSSSASASRRRPPEVWALECGGDLREAIGVPVVGRARLQGALRQRQRRLARDGGRPVLDGDGGADRPRDLATRCSPAPPTSCSRSAARSSSSRARRPLGLVHLENLTRSPALGALVLPAMPVVLRQARDARRRRSTPSSRGILDHLGLEHDCS